MPKVCYQYKTFSDASMDVIRKANAILEQYAAQGYDLTLRQLYYQFVARDLFPNDRTWKWTGAKWVRDPAGTKNAEPNYKWLGDIINDARMAGLIDWSYITDRTRNLRRNAHWDSPKDIIESCATQYQIDKWESQRAYVECWVEKDALIGVLQVACVGLDVPYFSCRGYTSQSEMWTAAQRILERIRAGKQVTIIHLGDHDPSGVDMSRDIEDRIRQFIGHHLIVDYAKAHPQISETQSEYHARIDREIRKLYGGDFEKVFDVNRIALTMEQITEYDPPPNPAKMTDSRAKDYVSAFGDESWELDALEPGVITTLIEATVLELRNDEIWASSVRIEDHAKAQLRGVAKFWDRVTKLIAKLTKKGENDVSDTD